MLNHKQFIVIGGRANRVAEIALPAAVVNAIFTDRAASGSLGPAVERNWKRLNFIFARHTAEPLASWPRKSDPRQRNGATFPPIKMRGAA